MNRYKKIEKGEEGKPREALTRKDQRFNFFVNNPLKIPADIKQAAIIMVGEIIKSGADGGDIKDISLGDYKVSYLKSEEVKSLAVNSGAISILENYKVYQV